VAVSPNGPRITIIVGSWLGRENVVDRRGMLDELNTVRGQLGHTGIKMTLCYAHPCPDTLTKVVPGIGQETTELFRAWNDRRGSIVIRNLT